MAEEKLLIGFDIDGTPIYKATQALDDMGTSAEATTTKVGGLRKELRASSEVTRELGESLGESGKSLAGVGEGARLAYAGIELLNGGLVELGLTLLTNPIFLIAAAIAGIVVAMVELHKEKEKEIKDLIKDNEEQEKYLKNLNKEIIAINKKSRAYKVSLGQMSKEDAARLDDQEENAQQIEDLAQGAAQRKIEILKLEDEQDKKISEARKNDDYEAENEAIKAKLTFL